MTVLGRDGSGLWSRQAYIKASNTDGGDIFGWSVAMDNDTLVVGAVNEDSAATGINGDQSDDNAPDSGAVYVFVRDGAGLWSQQAYIKASNSQSGDKFGWSVAIDGDTLAVGTFGEDSSATAVNGDQSDNSASDSGAVYIFVRDAAQNWSQQAYIKASNSDSDDFFGRSLALAGNTLAVGAFGEDSASAGINGDELDNSAFGRDPITDQLDLRGCGAGAAYVFTRGTDNAWSQEAYVKASNADAGDCFGISVALSGTTLAVGANQEESFASNINGDEDGSVFLLVGAAYVFVVDEDRQWSQQAYIKNSQPQHAEYFGLGVALVGDTLAVSAPAECSVSNGINSVPMRGSNDEWCADPALVLGEGAVFLFVRDSTEIWSQQAYVKASNNEVDGLDGLQSFGDRLVLSSDTLAVAAPGECGISTGINGDQSQDCPGRSHWGAVYIFH